MFEKATCLLTVLGLLLPAAGHASRPVPFCRFSTAKDMTIVGHRYRIADAYEAADLVVVGESLENPKNDARWLIFASSFFTSVSSASPTNAATC